MLKNYFTIGLRNLIRNKSYSAINLFGLAMGMTCTILILLWVGDELNYNKSHPKYPHIYQLIAHRNFNNQILTDRNMAFPLAEAIENEIPQINHAVVATHPQSVNIKYGKDLFRLTGRVTSPNFFQVFSVNYIRSGKFNPIQDPHSIVLTQSSAAAIFGDEDPLGKVMSINNEQSVTVTAVVKDMPANSTIQFDYIMSFDYSSDYIKESMDEWGSSSWVVFLEASPQADMAWVDEQINQIKIRNDPGDLKISTYFSFPMSKWRLYSDFSQGVNTGGMIEYVRLFSAIAIMVLLIACINFMNLATARSERRAKEVGIRKTLGSQKKQLIYQFFIESIILAFVAFLIAMLAVLLLLPAFNQLVNKQLVLNTAGPWFWLGAVIVMIFTGLVAGSYPALFLSSFNPVKVLKSTYMSAKSGVRPRQVLIVLQFVASILLISATVIVYQQITMIKNRDLGYDPNNLISVPGSDDTQKNYEAIARELYGTGMIQSVTRTMAPMTDIWWKSPGPDWEGKPDGVNIIFSGLATGVDFTRTMGIKVLQGRDFSGIPADSSYLLLNQAAVEEMGLEDPVGMQVKYHGDYTVLGVIENVVQESPFHPVEPMMIFYAPSNSYYISMRLQQGIVPKQALPAVESIFKKYNPARIFEFQFVDQEFEKKFVTEELIRKLSNIFAALAIFICCIGLAGLAAFTIEKRTREIGMRKILGANLHQLLMLISKDFLKLVLMAFAIAVPLSWWLMDQWLQNYLFRIEIKYWWFAAVGLAIILLALAVVSINTINASLRNPIKNLRAEL